MLPPDETPFSFGASLSSPEVEAFVTFSQDPRAHIETFITSSIGIAITSINAAASVTGSFVIIMIILRSGCKLGTVYHRILFCISVSDIIQSFAIALTTLPMPSDMIYEQFGGVVAGTKASCDAQGFLVILGATSSCLLHSVLCIYYLCSVCFKMNNKRFGKVLEAPLYIMSYTFSLFIAVTALTKGQINPSPTRVPWCANARYPWWCDNEIPNCAYERGNYDGAINALNLTQILLLSSASLVVLSMAAIVCYVNYQERSIIRALNQSSSFVPSNDEQECDSGSEQNSRRRRNHQRGLRLWKKNMQFTKDAVLSALLYNIAFFATWHYALHRFLRYLFYPKKEIVQSEVVQILRLIFRPLQGVFNMVIFIHHKIRNVRTHRPQTSRWKAFRELLDSENHPEYIVSNLTMVKRNQCAREICFECNHNSGGIQDIGPQHSMPPSNLNEVSSLDNSKAGNFVVTEMLRKWAVAVDDSDGEEEGESSEGESFQHAISSLGSYSYAES